MCPVDPAVIGGVFPHRRLIAVVKITSAQTGGQNLLLRNTLRHTLDIAPNPPSNTALAFCLMDRQSVEIKQAK